MRSIIQYIREYFYETDKKVLFAVTTFTAILVFINYQFQVDEYIRGKNSFIIKLTAWYMVFLCAFAGPYLFYRVIHKNWNFNPTFLFLVLVSPAIFAFKISVDTDMPLVADGNWNNYWNHILYWPLLGLMITGILFSCWKILDRQQPFYGLTTRDITWKPYLLMLFIMIPLVAAASTQQDFLAMYPKLKLIDDVYQEEGMHWWHKLLFELSYGSDFYTIELFFRGFLILAFLKWAGRDAILPMACFYCTIHFGKPLGECISSYFGGILLGIVVYNTRSILGGLLVHLGIAWMMELGGYLGDLLVDNLY